MRINDEELELLQEIREMFDNTHQYEGELWDEVCEVIDTEFCEDIEDLLRDCKYRLDDTHCYDTEIYQKLNEIV